MGERAAVWLQREVQDLLIARVLRVASFLAALTCSLQASAADYFVAVDGADTNPGSMASPFATLERAQMAAAPGDTVYVRGGVYKFSGTQATVGIAFTKSGQSGKPIRYFAYQGETPIFDLFELKPQARVTGLDVRCNWIHLRGFEVRGVRQLIVGDSWGVRIRGDHNVIERFNVHDNQAPGIFITSGASNLILNCDSHHNYDPLEDGGNADGFGCHSNGGDNVLRGCRAYENSDDGFDFINAPGTCTVEGSWAFRNGFVPDTTMTGANGAGFKAGGFGEPPNTPASGAPRHVVRQNVAFGNRAIGFYGNHHPGGIDFLNNTAFDNPANFDMRPPTGGTTNHKLRNNISLAPGRDIVNFNGGTDTDNSWTLSVQVSNADFASVDKLQALQPRAADGSLPSTTFVRLVSGSDLIDRGVDVGLPFQGKAPDLGAYEFGAVTEPVDAGAPDPTGAAGAAPGAGAGAGAQAGAGGAAGAQRPDAGVDAGAMRPAQAGMPAVVPPTAAGSSAAGAGAPAATTGTQTPAITGAGGAAAAPESGSDGCSCRVTGTRGAVSGAWAVVFALCFAARTRRRTRRPGFGLRRPTCLD